MVSQRALCLTPVPEYTRDLRYEDFAISFRPRLEKERSFTPADLYSQNKFENIFSAVVNIDQSNGLLHAIQAWAWVKTFGKGDVTLRLNSLLWSMLSLIIFLLGSRRYFGEKLALLAGILFAVHPILIHFSVDFRQFSQALFFSLLSTFTLMEILRGDTQKRAALSTIYILSVALAFFTHYVTAYVILGHIFICLLFLRDHKTWSFLSVGACFVLGLFTIWYFHGADVGLHVLGFYSRNFEEIFRMKDASGGTLVGNFVLGLLGLQASTSPVLWPFAIGCAGPVLFFAGKTIITRSVYVLLGIQIACLIFVVCSSVYYGHFAAFTERYILFALATGIIFFAFVVATGGKAARVLFLFQFLWALSLSGAFIISTRSYDWSSKNRFQKIASRLKAFDPEKFQVVYPEWNTAVLTTIYLPESVPLKAEVVPRTDKAIFVRHNLTGKLVPVQVR